MIIVGWKSELKAFWLSVKHHVSFVRHTWLTWYRNIWWWAVLAGYQLSLWKSVLNMQHTANRSVLHVRNLLTRQPPAVTAAGIEWRTRRIFFGKGLKHNSVIRGNEPVVSVIPCLKPKFTFYSATAEEHLGLFSCPSGCHQTNTLLPNLLFSFSSSSNGPCLSSQAAFILV